MTVSLSTAWMGAEPTAEQLLQVAQALDVRAFHASEPPARAALLRAELKGGGVRILSVSPSTPAGLSDPDTARAVAALEAAAQAASALKAECVVFEGGSPEPGGSEAATERVARAVHGLLGRGVPLAFRNGGGEHDLLGFQETEWLLSALPGLRLYFDPAHAERAARQTDGPSLTAWMDAFAGRCAGVFVHGLGSSGAGGAHPADDGPPWSTLVSSLPTRVPWVLDPGADMGAADVEDALRFLRSVVM